MSLASRIDQIKDFLKNSTLGLTSVFWREQMNVQKDNWFFWLPIFLACGIGLYFTLPSEPPLILPFFFLVLTYVLYRATTHEFAKNIALIILIMVTGFCLAKLRTEHINATMIEKIIGPVNIIGDIYAIEPLEDGQGSRLILQNLDIEKLNHNQTPKKIRLKLRNDKEIEIGQRIKVLASLNPPSPPLLPGGFDFRRYMFFRQIGAVGFIYHAPEILKNPAPQFFKIQKIRKAISDRLEKTLPAEQSAIALALIVGQKHAIDDENTQAIRDAGLAHMLAISGLHIGLASGAAYFILRLVLACFPTLALRYPIKKISAIGALICAVFYMIIAGSTIPTQRAVYMSAVVFLAIILDRSPISLRLVAFSALIVLAIAPESLLSASFHMSFAAVTTLVYFYEVTRQYWRKFYTSSKWINKLALYFVGVCLTTIIASIATAPFAIYHFGQVSLLGSIANLVAVPLLAFIIMPFALLGLLLMPLSLDTWPLYIMGLGIDGIIEIADWAAKLPYAVIRTQAWSFSAFLVLIIGALWVILCRGYGKLLSIPLILISFTMNKPLADILVSADHKLYVFRSDNGGIYTSSKRKERFVLKNWEEYYGLEEGDSIALRYKGSEKQGESQPQCGENGCRFNIGGYNVSYAKHSYILEQECSWANILVSTEPIGKIDCNTPYTIDKFDTWKNGAHGIWIRGNSIKVKNVADYSSNRPWSIYHEKSK